MNWLLISGLISIALFFGAWFLRTKNYRKNIIPTEVILEEIKNGRRGRDQYDEEVAFMNAAISTHKGYTFVIKITFYIGVIMIALSFF